MKTSYFPFAITLIFVVFIQSVVFASSPESEIRSRWDAFIEFWEAGDAQACAEFYFEDGLNIPPGLPENIGRRAIQEFYAFLFSGQKSSSYTHTTKTLNAGGNIAIEYGNFTVEWVEQDGFVWIYEARCMVHWEKATDGVWYIRTLLFNNPPSEE